MEESAIEKDQKERKELVDKRLWSIQEAFDQLKDRFPQTFKDCYLESELLRETVESYLDDRQAYMVRNRMARPKRIMYHKIAGLMAAAICKYRPVQFSQDSDTPRVSLLQNEILALWHGIAVCVETYIPRQSEVIMTAYGDESFLEWETQFLSQLHRHADSAQAFIVIFHTLCLRYFPKAVDPTEAPTGD